MQMHVHSATRQHRQVRVQLIVNVQTCIRSRPKRMLIALKNVRCLPSRPGSLSGDSCRSRTSDEFFMENATRTPVDMKSFEYCSRTNNTMSVMSPPAKSVLFLMFPVPSTIPNYGGTRRLHARVQRREEGVWTGWGRLSTTDDLTQKATWACHIFPCV